MDKALEQRDRKIEKWVDSLNDQFLNEMYKQLNGASSIRKENIYKQMDLYAITNGLIRCGTISLGAYISMDGQPISQAF